MDVLEIPKTKDLFRIMLDAKGRFALVRISPEESTTKLCKIVKRITQANRIPAVVTHDGRTIRYPDPNIAAGDTVAFDTNERKVRDFTKFKVGTLAMITGGKNMGRVGTVSDIERHPGSFNIVHIRDKADNTFATRETNVFVIGRDQSNPQVTLPKGDGIRTNVLHERELRLERNSKNARRVR